MKNIKKLMLLSLIFIASCDLDVEANKSDIVGAPTNPSAITIGMLYSFSAGTEELAGMDGIYTDVYDATNGYSYMNEIETKSVSKTNVASLEVWANMLTALDGLENLKKYYSNAGADANNYKFIYHYFYATWLETIARYYVSVPRPNTKARYTAAEARAEALAQITLASGLGYNPSETMKKAFSFSLTSGLVVKTLNTLKARIYLADGQNSAAATAAASGLTSADESIDWKFTEGSSGGTWQWVNGSVNPYIDIDKAKFAVLDSVSGSHSDLFPKYITRRNAGGPWALKYIEKFASIPMISGLENEMILIETSADLTVKANKIESALIKLGMSNTQAATIKASITGDDAKITTEFNILHGLALMGQGHRYTFAVRRGLPGYTAANAWNLPTSFDF